MSNILIIDDETDIRDLISDILIDEGYTTILASNATKAIEAVTNNNFSAIILDIWLEGSELDGIGVLKAIKSISPSDLPIIMISGHGNIETAVQTIKLGAYDFIEKPFKAEKLILMVERAVKNYQLIQENISLKNQNEDSLNILAGKSKPMQNFIKLIKTAAASQSRIIIKGEDGTGKEFLAKYIHKNSPRANKNFGILNANNINEQNFESELLGKEHKIGILQICKGGTIYIDEIADLPLKVQAKFLNILQDTKYNIRFIAGSSKDLTNSIKNGELSSSLYYRMNVVPIAIIPLRDRKDDIETLCIKFIKYYSKIMNLPSLELSSHTINALQFYDWPGNVRQLKNVIEWLMIMKAKDKKLIEPDDLPNEIRLIKTTNSDNSFLLEIFSKPLKEARELFEKYYLNMQLVKYNMNISKASSAIGINRSALHRKIKSLNIFHDQD